MKCHDWGSGRRIAGICCLPLLALGLSTCAPAIGGGVLVAVVAAGALTAHCYDYLDVTVYDAEGRKTCKATVTATQGSDVEELKSCYYTPLSDGQWTIRATLPGVPDATTLVMVEHENDCIRHVQSLQLSLNPQGYVSAPRPGNVVPAVQPAPSPAVSTPTTTSPALPPPPPPPSNSAGPVNSANPATPAPAAPPVGTFPDQAKP